MVTAPERDITGTKGYYYPIVFQNEFWHLREHYVEVNSTTPTLPLEITFQPMSFMKFQMFASMAHGFKEAAKQQGGSGGAEMDEIKRMFMEVQLFAARQPKRMGVEFILDSAMVADPHWLCFCSAYGVNVLTLTSRFSAHLGILSFEMLAFKNDVSHWRQKKGKA